MIQNEALRMFSSKYQGGPVREIGIGGFHLSDENTKQLTLFETMLEELSLESALSFLQNHLELLCTPIIFDDKRVQLGYDSENIRKFIPKEKRRVDARIKMSHLREKVLLAG
nr:ArsC/Spx/MgsR family protein [Lactococcus petauri]